MGKVFKTLLQNAVRAAKASPTPAIWLKSEIRGSIVEVSFANTGPLIPADVRALLFREPARSAEGGQGVGLLIARAIVFGYGGDLHLASSEGNETVFTLSLPLALRAPEGDTTP
jgi:two-component system C4-dicarboxylate transport sensor histidine kinase DctB